MLLYSVPHCVHNVPDNYNYSPNGFLVIIFLAALALSLQRVELGEKAQ